MAAPSSTSGPQKPDPAVRPLSPHLTIYHWAPTMIVSITHRATGVALTAGMMVLAWWLAALSNGPDGYAGFYALIASPPGLVVLFGFTWSLAFHALQGIRHLAWDAGWGYDIPTTYKTGRAVLIATGVLTALTWLALLISW